MTRTKQAAKRRLEHPDKPDHFGRTHVLFHNPHKRAKFHSNQQAAVAADTMGDTTMSEAKSKKSKDSDELDMHMMPGLSRSVWGFPKNIVTKIKYCQINSLASTSGAVNYNVFRANSIFDPDQTGTGHQPMFNDNYATIYNNYRVLGSTIKCTFTPLTESFDVAGPSSSKLGPWYIGINGTNSTSSYSATPETRWEANDSSFAVLNTRTGADGVMTLTETYSPVETLGRPASDDVVSGVTNANPSQQWYWQPWFADASGSTSSVVIFTEIHYTVQFFNLINQSQN